MFDHATVSVNDGCLMYAFVSANEGWYCSMIDTYHEIPRLISKCQKLLLLQSEKRNIKVSNKLPWLNTSTKLSICQLIMHDTTSNCHRTYIELNQNTFPFSSCALKLDLRHHQHMLWMCELSSIERNNIIMWWKQRTYSRNIFRKCINVETIFLAQCHIFLVFGQVKSIQHCRTLMIYDIHSEYISTQTMISHWATLAKGMHKKGFLLYLENACNVSGGRMV